MKIRQLATACPLLAALLVAAPFVAAGTVIVHAGRLLDVERGHYRENHSIRIDDGRITSIGPRAGDASGDARVVDWSAYTVLPGLIDLHTHLIGDISSANIASPLLSSAAEDALLGVAHARATLDAGFTTVRDVGVYRAFTDVALRDAINAGLVEGPRMFVAGAYLTVSAGGGEVTGLAPDVAVPAEMRRGVANSVDEVRQRVREILGGSADFIKIIANGAVFTAGTKPSAPEFSEEELRAGVRSIEHASYLDAEGIELMRRHGSWLIADVYNGDYTEEVGGQEGWSAEILRKNRETTGTQRVAFRNAVQAGVRIGFGTDAGIFPRGQNARQFAYLVRHGLSPLDAIRSATIHAARCLGVERDLGSISPGRFADMIAVGGDPLADVELLRKVEAVMKGGRLVTRSHP